MSSRTWPDIYERMTTDFPERFDRLHDVSWLITHGFVPDNPEMTRWHGECEKGRFDLTAREGDGGDLQWRASHLMGGLRFYETDWQPNPQCALTDMYRILDERGHLDWNKEEKDNGKL